LGEEVVRMTRSRLLGIGSGLALYGIGLGLLALSGFMREQDRDLQFWASFMFFLVIVAITTVLFIASMIMVSFPRTKAFATGLLISVAIGVLLDGGVCVAVTTG
jgi:hypothetical protein